MDPTLKSIAFKLSTGHRRVLIPGLNPLGNLFNHLPVIALNDGLHRVLPHDLSATKLLRSLGLNVPNPALTYPYKGFTGTRSPFRVQLSTIDLLTMHDKCYVLNEMGTGKTSAVLWAWDILRTANLAGKLLVVAKLSNLSQPWAAEAFTAIPWRKVGILHGTKKQRLEVLNDKTVDIYVINHDGITVLYEELFSHPDIDTICIDELAAFRNVNPRTKKMRAIARSKQRTWGLTGSPMPNEPVDVWCQCSIITPNTVPKYRGAFRDQTMFRKNMIWLPKPGATDTAYAAMQPAVRYTLDEVVELPPIITRVIDVELSDEQKKIYTSMKNVFQAMVANQQITAVNAGVAVNKLLQIAGGWVYDTAKGVVHLENSKRVDAVLDLIESAEHKVILLAPYLHTIAGLEEALTRAKVPFAQLQGNREERNHVLNQFQNGTDSFKVLLSHPARLSHGLTLTAADTIIHYLPITSYETYEQVNARIRRVGQKHHQHIFHVRGSGIEAKTYRTLERRETLQQMFLQMFED